MKEPAEFPHTPGSGSERPVSSLIQSILGHVREILRSEVRLARTEMQEEIRQATAAGKLLGAAGVIGLYAAGFILLAAVYALSNVIPAWAGAGAVGVVLAIVAAICLSAGRRRMRRFHATPEKTVHSVKENIEWIRKRTG